MSPKSVFFCIVALLVFSSPSFACCTAWGGGARPVQIAAQEVLLIWDAENGMEHFVRRASFQSEKEPEDFGFLVPTPRQPMLSEVPDRIFDTLSRVIAPKIETRQKTKLSFMPAIFAPWFLADELATKNIPQVAGGVDILQIAIVGGFEVAVLRAAETGELLKWLEENDYDARPELREWLTPYVEKKWIITAFKYLVKNDSSPAALARASVCLSFETDAPFFPYRVPSDVRVKPENGSLLRLYFAGTERVSGEFEGGGDAQEWNATTKYSDRDKAVLGVLGEVLKNDGDEADLPDASWLTAFEDETWPGGARDLYFKPSSEKDAINPAPVMKAQVKVIHLPADLLLLCLAIVGYCYFKISRHRKRKASGS